MNEDPAQTRDWHRGPGPAIRGPQPGNKGQATSAWLNKGSKLLPSRRPPTSGLQPKQRLFNTRPRAKSTPEVRGQEPEVRSQGSRSRGQSSETTAKVEKARGQNSESRVRPEVRGQGSRTRGQGSKLKGQGQKFRGQGPGQGSRFKQRVKSKCSKAEAGGQSLEAWVRAEARGQSSDAWVRPEAISQSSESRVRPEARGQGSNTRGPASKPKGQGQRFKGQSPGQGLSFKHKGSSPNV